MAEKRRDQPRVKLDIGAKGVLRVEAEIFQFTAKVFNLTKNGAGIALSHDAKDRVKKAMDKGLSFDQAEVMMHLISYVVENIQATGFVTRISESGGFMMMGVKLNPLGKSGDVLLEKLLEKSPYLKEAKSIDPREADSRFASLDEFIRGLSEYTILTEKKSIFFIGKERFAFTGMHRDDNGEIHSDCIESVDHPGKIFCPDCRAKIRHNELL